MLVRDFLRNVAPGLKTIIWDLDAVPGNNKKEDEAGALAVAHHFDYDSKVIDFFIYHDNLTLWISRKKEDKK